MGQRRVDVDTGRGRIEEFGITAKLLERDTSG